MRSILIFQFKLVCQCLHLHLKLLLHLVDQLVDLRSLYRVTEQIIIIDQAVKEEHGKSAIAITEDKTSQCLTWIFLSRTDVHVFAIMASTIPITPQISPIECSFRKGKWQIKKAADNTCNAADQGSRLPAVLLSWMFFLVFGSIIQA